MPTATTTPARPPTVQLARFTVALTLRSSAEPGRTTMPGPDGSRSQAAGGSWLRRRGRERRRSWLRVLRSGRDDARRSTAAAGRRRHRRWQVRHHRSRQSGSAALDASGPCGDRCRRRRRPPAFDSTDESCRDQAAEAPVGVRCCKLLEDVDGRERPDASGPSLRGRLRRELEQPARAMCVLVVQAREEAGRSGSADQCATCHPLRHHHGARIGSTSSFAGSTRSPTERQAESRLCSHNAGN